MKRIASAALALSLLVLMGQDAPAPFSQAAIDQAYHQMEVAAAKRKATSTQPAIAPTTQPAVPLVFDPLPPILHRPMPSVQNPVTGYAMPFSSIQGGMVFNAKRDLKEADQLESKLKNAPNQQVVRAMEGKIASLRQTAEDLQEKGLWVQIQSLYPDVDVVALWQSICQRPVRPTKTRRVADGLNQTFHTEAAAAEIRLALMVKKAHELHDDILRKDKQIYYDSGLALIAGEGSGGSVSVEDSAGNISTGFVEIPDSGAIFQAYHTLNLEKSERAKLADELDDLISRLRQVGANVTNLPVSASPPEQLPVQPSAPKTLTFPHVEYSH